MSPQGCAIRASSQRVALARRARRTMLRPAIRKDARCAGLSSQQAAYGKADRRLLNREQPCRDSSDICGCTTTTHEDMETHTRDGDRACHTQLGVEPARSDPIAALRQTCVIGPHHTTPCARTEGGRTARTDRCQVFWRRVDSFSRHVLCLTE